MYLYWKSSALCFKKNVMKFIYFLSIAFSVIGLSACGGGGGEENNNVLPPATIDSSNATKLAQVTVATAFELTETGELSYMGDTDALAAASRVALSRFTPRSVRYTLEPQTMQCADSGTMTMSGDIGGQDSLSVGDVIRMEADSCNDGNGVVDGMIQMTIARLDGDTTTSAFLLGLDVLFSEFTLTDSDGEIVFDGDIGITLDTRQLPVTTVNVSGDYFSISGMGQTQSISNFSNSYTVDSSVDPVTWIHDVQGVISSTALAGSVDYQTPVRFQGTGDSYPDTGEFLITGANNATLRLKAVDEVNIEIDADYDGDGNIDRTFYMTWAELME